MPRIAFDYRFLVKLPTNAETAYRWATDYAVDDPARMGQQGRRKVQRVAPRTLLLTDTVQRAGKTVTKTRLVRLRPKERSWTNTHFVGPTQYSQFLYRIRPAGPRRSTLEFIGLQVEFATRSMSPREVERRARTVAHEDATTWRKYLVPSMIGDLGLGRPRRARPRRK